MLRSFSLLLLLPAVTFAQTPEVVAKIDAKLDAERAAQRNEDVEILRRLLNKAAGLPDIASVSVTEQPVQRFSGARDSLRDGNAPTAPVVVQVARSSAAVGPFDGVYLPGAGVVFTLHVPAGAPTTTHGDRIGLNSACNTCHQTQAHAAVPASVSLATCTTCHSDVPKGEAQLSDWDRVKQDVRGDKSKPADKPKGDKSKTAVCEPGNLQTLIAGVLAANAKNVRHLGEKEGVSVVVTFDDGSEKPAYKQIALDDDATRTLSPPTGYSLGSKPFSPEELKALNLGDLHLKQGKHKEACDAYGAALDRFRAKPFKVSAPATLTAEQKRQYADELQKGVRDAMKSYAKALLLSDQTERAKEALELATGFVVLEVSPISTPAASTGPAKLIVTVSKADIDAAKDATAVKKAVKAERLNFPK